MVISFSVFTFLKRIRSCVLLVYCLCRTVRFPIWLTCYRVHLNVHNSPRHVCCRHTLRSTRQGWVKTRF